MWTLFEKNNLLGFKGKTVVLFDGRWLICRIEVGIYKTRDVSGKLCFIDISDQNFMLPWNIDRRVAMSHFSRFFKQRSYTYWCARIFRSMASFEGLVKI